MGAAQATTGERALHGVGAWRNLPQQMDGEAWAGRCERAYAFARGVKVTTDDEVTPAEYVGDGTYRVVVHHPGDARTAVVFTRAGARPWCNGAGGSSAPTPPRQARLIFTS